VKTELTAIRVLALGRLAVGTIGMIAPRRVARLFSAPEEPKALVYSMALRDLVLGAGILLSDRPGPWLVAAGAVDAADAGLVVGYSGARGLPALKALGALGAGVAQWVLAKRVGR
jgi:hypothetical protein